MAIASVVSLVALVFGAAWWNSPSHIDNLIASAENHTQRQEYGEALADYAVVVVQEPLDVDVRIARAVTASEAELQQETIEFWQAAIEAARNSEPSRKEEVEALAKSAKKKLANKHIQDGWRAFDEFDYENGVKAFTRVFELQLRNTEASFGRAQCSIELGEFDLAKSDLEDVFPKTESQDIAFRMSRANLMIKSLRWEKALTELKFAMAHHRNCPEFAANRGLVLTLVERFEEARPLLHDAVRKCPDFPRAWRNLALVYQYENTRIKTGLSNQVIEWLEQASSLGLETPGLYELRARVAIATSSFPVVKREKIFLESMSRAIDLGLSPIDRQRRSHFPDISDDTFDELVLQKRQLRHPNRSSNYLYYNHGKWPLTNQSTGL
jgi:tetratricopeptide (TPR) repeat protein